MSEPIRCAVCGVPWDGHVTRHELVGPADNDSDGNPLRTCAECDEQQRTNPSPGGGVRYMRLEHPRTGRVTWGWAFVDGPLEGVGDEI